MEETRKRSDKKISKTKEKDYDDKEEELSHENEEEKRRRKEIRRHKKVVDRLALLGLDENGEPLDNFSLLKYPVREWIFTLPGSREKIALNPAVTVLSMVGLWVLVMCLTCK